MRAPKDVNSQAYFFQVSEAISTLNKLGGRLPVVTEKRLSELARQNDAAAVNASELILRRYVLVSLAVDSEAVQIASSGAAKTLAEQGWRVFLLRVVNTTGRKQTIALSTSGTPFPQAAAQIRPFPSAGWNGGGTADPLYDIQDAVPLIKDMWVLSEVYGTIPLTCGGVPIPAIPLSGDPIEYRVVQIFSRDPGQNKTSLSVYSFANVTSLPRVAGSRQFKFDCLPARNVTFEIYDTDGRGCTASLKIRDKAGRVYPPRIMRVVPDMPSHDHVYRSDGETMHIADGDYIVESTRGPEYFRIDQAVTIDDAHSRIGINLKRWINPSDWGWYSGDAHMHGNCCIPYRIPAKGVPPETMIRGLRGEGLAIGEVLAFALEWPYQSHFFTQRAQSPPALLEYPALQAANHTSLVPHGTEEDFESTLHYGVETSAFPSENSGHLVLLRLKELHYPGVQRVEDWPSWNLPILRWTKEQGGCGGYGHSGVGLAVNATELPNYEIPSFSGHGANEAIVDAAFGMVGFIGGCDDGNPIAELNLWYHLLNCGWRLAFTGESDYPAPAAERPGSGRSYVRLDTRPIGDVGYNEWISGLQAGRLYSGDGRSHFLEFHVNGVHSGAGDLAVKSPATVTIEGLVAARLEPLPPSGVGLNSHFADGTDKEAAGMDGGWHLERARIGATRNVKVELVVNGYPVSETVIVADGSPKAITFKTVLDKSSWIALRVFPSSHTYPIFALVDAKPVRPSRRSALWCVRCIDRIWEATSPHIRDAERSAASEAFNQAKRIYDMIVSESHADA